MEQVPSGEVTNEQHAEVPSMLSAVEEHKLSKLLYVVFVTIIFGTLQDIFNSSLGIVWKYIKHLFLCLHYFWSPDIDRPPFSTFNFKDFCKHSFETVVLILLISFFMVKVNWLDSTDENIKEQISDDLKEIGYEAALFFLFAVVYLLLIVISVGTGRLIRKWLTPEVSPKESDILMITFFNSYFSITALTALIIRTVVSFRDNDLDAILEGTGIILMLICFILTLLWAVRFIQLNKVRGWKTIFFFLFSIILYPLLFSIGGMVTVGLLYIV